MKRERLYPTTCFSEFKRHIDTALAMHSAACDLLERRLTRKPAPDEDRIGRTAGGTVLEALAIELVLKERLGLAVMRSHRHDQLFKKLPPSEREVLRRRYEAACPDRFSSTLDEALARSSTLFEVWRYAHESVHVQADIEELVYVFEVLQAGL